VQITRDILVTKREQKRKLRVFVLETREVELLCWRKRKLNVIKGKQNELKRKSFTPEWTKI